MTDPLDFSAYEQMLNSRPPQVTNVRLRFFYHPEQNKAKSEAAGRPIFDQVEMISVINPGSRDEFIAPVTDEMRAQYSGAYEHWKRTQEQPSDGTPLEEVPFLNVAQVKELRALNIESLEHLAGLTDALKQRLGMGAVELVRKAQAYLAAAKGHAGESRLVAETEELKRQVVYLQQSLAEANQRYEKLLAGAAPAPAAQPQAQPAPAIDIQQIAMAVAAVLQGKVPHDEKQESQTPKQEYEAVAAETVESAEAPRRRRRV